LSLLEWRVLTTLAAEGPLPVVCLARRVGVKQPTMTRLLDRLVRRAMVQRTPDPGDRRRTLVEATPAGRSRIEDKMWKAQPRPDGMLALFGRERRRLLETLLSDLVGKRAGVSQPA
jgi:DNA-binding MarR family transcriptional regulator